MEENCNRFFKYVEKTNKCWNWVGAKSKFGHGRFKIKGKLYSPHRLIWAWTVGAIPEGKLICHTCDNPACVNPSHLFLGSFSDNMKDAYSKGRMRIPYNEGEQIKWHKLTQKQVVEIRKLSLIKTQTELGEIYGVHRRTIGDVLIGKTWKSSRRLVEG